MPVLKAFLQAILYLLLYVTKIYMVVIVVRALISWVNPDPYNPIVRILSAITDPVLRPFRRLVSPYRTGGIDFSPIFVILILYFIQLFLQFLFFQLGWR